MAFTIRGDMTVHNLSVTLDDGRIVDLHPNGSVRVRAGERDSNGYVLELPTVAEIAIGCDTSGRDCDTAVMAPVYHRP
jgi:hypothetical protein